MKISKAFIFGYTLIGLILLTAAVLPPRPLPPVLPTDQQDFDPPELAALVLSISADHTQAQADQTVVFRILVANPDSSPARGVKVIGIFPAEFTLISAVTQQGMVGFKPHSGRVNAQIGVVQPGDSVEIVVETRVNAGILTPSEGYAGAKISYTNGFVSNQFFSNWVRVSLTQ